ncbi:MAG: lysophospholipid acyltransferase family protein [Candidatus Microthrix sp.]|jgi:1-acyl-sn-glycerol-3-phosphate acyltransferase|uniref:Putative acyltransferase n=1 Tax=Candidatus Neomicrothrix parvicella RN1 TaxID=1229780 RepID=R4Z2Y0_9ACTN|nr:MULTISPECIES: lysophospholipid acyltransferase family protein [Microthrix]NLH67095.1 acyl-phosphate glycerol 3-phosphate acyltransferase [Candidatus Microthrix parvicella]MBK6503857.1 lysophospholipid acyltransferase family protein [Candidatus Microthrix sp.]MBK7019431.1 lysophospholipid acyltransferase family protein [Candidatus Microthrix sp.]MBL0204402.1 lysophospholipid acyltransferase family protein [Candidatus Microthrix sp.]MBP6134359.1 lysophospholipid acyltransferase family protein
MKKVLARFFLWLSRLTFVGEPPKESCVLVAGPHTSNWDFLFMLSYAWVTDVPLRWLGKEELFKGPMGPIMRATGGIAVDRDHPGGLVEQMAERFRDGPRMGLVITPEGTRGKRDYWKSGFYRIARAADVPIVLGYIDWPNRTGGFGPTFKLTGDVHADMERIRDLYDNITGIRPQGQTSPRLREEDRSLDEGDDTYDDR